MAVINQEGLLADALWANADTIDLDGRLPTMTALVEQMRQDDRDRAYRRANPYGRGLYGRGLPDAKIAQELDVEFLPREKGRIPLPEFAQDAMDQTMLWLENQDCPMAATALNALRHIDSRGRRSFK